MLDVLEAEARDLILPRFDEAVAWRLGTTIVELGEGLPIVVNIRTEARTLFHASLPGASANNDNWARRKSNVALHFAAASFLVRHRMAAKGDTLDTHGLPAADYAIHGGAVPVVVAGVGMVAVATVSGLPQADDHALVVAALRRIIAG